MPSHKRLLEQKSFEKRYVLDSVDEGKQIASVTMKASESDKPAVGAPSQGGFGIMAKMFDTQEVYEGKMDFDLNSGKVILVDEKLVAIYIAADAVKSADKGPDTLTMGLTHHISVEKVD